MQSSTIQRMQTERDLFEARVELKKFRKMNPKQILYIFKQIRDCSAINKHWIRKTRITKTLARIAQHKYTEQDELRTLVIKFSKSLLNKFKSFFPKLSTTSTTVQQQSKVQSSSSSNNKQPTQPSQPAPSAQRAPLLTKPQEGQASALPTYSNQRRNQGLQGFLKYFQKSLEESQLPLSQTICVEIEKYLYSRNTKADNFLEDAYKNDVKKLCSQFLDKEIATTLKKQIFQEFKSKQSGSLDCISKIFN